MEPGLKSRSFADEVHTFSTPHWPSFLLSLWSTKIINLIWAKVGKTSSSKEKATGCLNIPWLSYPSFPPLAHLTPFQWCPASNISLKLCCLAHILVLVGRMPVNTWLHWFYCYWLYRTEPWFSSWFVCINSVDLRKKTPTKKGSGGLTGLKFKK